MKDLRCAPRSWRLAYNTARAEEPSKLRCHLELHDDCMQFAGHIIDNACLVKRKKKDL